MLTFPNSQKQKQVAKEKKKEKNVFQVKIIVQILRVYLHCEIKKLKLNALFKTNIIFNSLPSEQSEEVDFYFLLN